MKTKSYPLYRMIFWLVKLFFPKMTVEGTENLPGEACVIVGNHCQINGPIACELYSPVPRATWCAGEMMSWKEIPEYAFRDFWSQKPRWTHWFYRIMAYLIAPLSMVVFNNAETVATYHDNRAIRTFRDSVRLLGEGTSLVIFPERDAPRNHIVYDFQTRFVDVAKLYYRKSGRAVDFVPLYISPKLGKMVYGKPVRFDPTADINTERQRICDAMADEITAMAEALPLHTVIPYRNIPKKLYPTNRPKEK